MSLVIISVMIYAALYDLRDCKIPNKAVIAIICIALMQATMTTYEAGNFSSVTLTNALAGFGVGLAICLFLHFIGIFGAGDAKLLASIGLVVGFPDIILVIAYSVLIAGGLSLLRLACYGELRNLITRWVNLIVYRTYEPPATTSIAANAIPMGGAILLATMFCHFYVL